MQMGSGWWESSLALSLGAAKEPQQSRPKFLRFISESREPGDGLHGVWVSWELVVPGGGLNKEAHSEA